MDLSNGVGVGTNRYLNLHRNTDVVAVVTKGFSLKSKF